MIKPTSLVLAAALMAATAGCINVVKSGDSGKGKSNNPGIQSARYLVGGGFEIDYVAPANGTAIWIEETTGKILETKSAKKGESVQFELDAEPAEIERVLGIEMKNVNLKLYFIPVAELESSTAEAKQPAQSDSPAH